ncbi:nucleoside-diphosphate sugar epimerase [Bosea sp. Root381]|uniref:SDR family oxidoreductase n=1 Tax=Bosea sp. Root381 TaxID=1736524 RepID=UPI0006FD6248|nr:SDR family oxidoreductase [Bosea sp. Root381]KRE05061.1 nucleoside-diphosphate sugar epimerase [Bosea sp. Root381]
MDRIAVIGATGLIGSSIAAALITRGIRVVGVARHIGDAPRRHRTMEWSAAELGRTDRAEWETLLEDVTAVVNCAGALQDGPSDDIEQTHRTGLADLVAGCRAAGVERFVHFSAMGVDRATPTRFSATKRAGDDVLSASGLDWIILRPSVVLGPSAYGASALIRGLSSLPYVPVMPDTGALRPVALEDVVATVGFFLSPDAPTRVAVELAGPERFEFVELVRLYRRWLGLPPAVEFAIPRWMAALAYRTGDFAGRLGWRPPIRSTARLEVARGATGDDSEWKRLTGLEPRRISQTLEARPASVQDRWFASLYLLKPIVIGSLAIFWIGSGLASLGPGLPTGMSLMEQGGVTGLWAKLVIVGGGLADLSIGIGIAFRKTARPAMLAGIGVSLAYALAGSWVTPWLWFDPLAPILKIAPVIALMAVGLATLRDR